MYTAQPDGSGSTSCASSVSSDVLAAELDSEESCSDEDQETTKARETVTTSERSTSMVVSLLDRLRVPKKSELTRKKKYLQTRHEKVHVRVKSARHVLATRNHLLLCNKSGSFQMNALLCLQGLCFVTHVGKK